MLPRCVVAIVIDMDVYNTVSQCNTRSVNSYLTSVSENKGQIMSCDIGSFKKKVLRN